MGKKAKRPEQPAGPQYPIVIETFKEFGQRDSRWDEPTCFNGWVRVQKYRITIEKIDEPKEVIQLRLLKLWRECDNMHHYGPLKNAAKEIGYELPHDQLSKDRKRN